MEGRWTPLQFLGAYLVLLAAEARLITGQGIYTNTWAIHIEGGAEEAERIAHKHGFISHGQENDGTHETFIQAHNYLIAWPESCREGFGLYLGENGWIDEDKRSESGT
ncbi:furin-1-like protein [Labeo rohita]|uniref:Furin-1-like protein n=1 Tax=Labeo rohita TaxID=84645 RepID=A0A498N196_LABRO|nr:furin-1-like protein [Labeo rohita]RXN37361.1 furin-1-like protein [Labeo rohita]